jgi:hypothetical protein
VGVGLGEGEKTGEGVAVGVDDSVVSDAGKEVLDTGVSCGTLAAQPETRKDKRMIIVQTSRDLCIFYLDKRVQNISKSKELMDREDLQLQFIDSR